MHEMAHQIRPFIYTQWDSINTEIEYDTDQSLPSPVMMADYEGDVNISNATFYSNHKNRAPSAAPCRSGESIRAYTKWLDEANWNQR